MAEPDETIDARFRFLQPGEGHILADAIRVAYGETYDVRWVYDETEVNKRLQAGTYVSCVAESPDGDLLCHEGMSLAAAGDAVGHSGQAVTMPQARGQHLFTRTKRFLMDWAKEQGLAGMYSEATAAHPYSQKANLDLGAHETGFLLGWIPASVSNDAAADHKPGGSRRCSSTQSSTTATSGRSMPRPATTGSSNRPSSSASSAAPSPTHLRDRPTRPHRAPRRDRRRPQPRPDHRPRARRRSRDRRSPPSATTSSTLRTSMPFTWTSRWRKRRRRWSPSTWSASASPTQGSSRIAGPTATSCGCSPSTACGSRPTT